MRVDVDAQAGVAAAPGAGAQLEKAPLELHGVIVLDRAAVLEAADAIEIGRSGAPGGLGMGGGLGEAGIVAMEKPVEDALRLRERAGAGQAELDHQAILEGPKEPFNPTRRLRRPGGDPANAQLLERAADLGGLYGALELFVQRARRTGIAVKDPMAIGVGGRRDAIAADELAEQEEVALGIFLEPKDAAEHLSCRIVDRGVKDEAGTAVLEPGVLAAVHLDEEPRLGHALAAAAMAWGAAGAGTAEAGLPEEPADRRAGQAQGFALPQQLGEMVVVRAGIGGAGQGEDPGPDGVRKAACGSAAAVAMGQRRETLLTNLGKKPTEVPHGKGQELSCGLGRQDPGLDAGEDMCALLLFLGQGNRLPVHSPRVTESLIC